LHLAWIAFLIVIFTVMVYKIKNSLWNPPRGFWFNAILAVSAILVTVSMVLYPQEAFDASLHGLSIWWNVVFPALLPFFIMAQILIGLGVVHMMGVFLEPVMRPLFNVPGVGSFVLAMGLASGFPLGAIITADMRRKQMVGKIEAERLLSFVNTADPLFMFGAVAVGMLGRPDAGMTIAAAHYTSTLTVGMIMRFYRKKESSPHPEKPSSLNMVARPLQAMTEARKKDGRPFGQLMGDAINKSVETLLLIGGFIILFSVIIRVLTVVGAVEYISTLIAFFLNLVGLDVNLTPAIISGLLEIDLGCQFASTAKAPMEDILIASGFIIAWSGLSVHAQVASIISDTDLSIVPYVWARGIHSLLAGFYTFLILNKPFDLLQHLRVPTLYHNLPSATPYFWWFRTLHLTQQVVYFLGALFVISVLIYLIRYKLLPARSR